MNLARPKSRPVRIAVIGDPIPGFSPQMAIETALGHSAAATGATVEVTWHPTLTLARAADDLMSDADAVWCAPGSPYQSLTGALAGIRFAREHHLPFLGTCAGFQHAVIVNVTDPHLRGIYDADNVKERYYCRFGLREAYLPQLASAGLAVAGTDPADGGTRIMRLTGHPFFYLTLFVPQTSSTPRRPHPLVTACLAAARATRTP